MSSINLAHALESIAALRRAGWWCVVENLDSADGHQWSVRMIRDDGGESTITETTTGTLPTAALLLALERVRRQEYDQ